MNRRRRDDVVHDSHAHRDEKFLKTLGRVNFYDVDRPAPKFFDLQASSEQNREYFALLCRAE